MSGNPKSSRPELLLDKSVDPSAERFLGIQQVIGYTSLGKSSIYNLIDAKQFPQPYRLTTGPGGRVAWKKSEIDQWISSRQKVV